MTEQPENKIKISFKSSKTIVKSIITLGDRTSSEDNDRDLIFGTGGDEWIENAINEDRIVSDRDNKVLYGGFGDDLLEGGPGNDVLIGDLGDDTLQGGLGDDTLQGGLGDDILIGGSGTDVFVFDSLEEGLDSIQDFDVSSDTIAINALGFGIDNSIVDSISGFDFDSNTGTLSYKGKEFLTVNSDGSFDIIANVKLL